MALSGTLETFSLPDVLRLLASTKKTGLLTLEGDRGIGRVWVDDGDIVAADSDGASGEIDGVVFDLLRFADGSFEFDAGAAPTDHEARHGVDAALQAAESLLEEWREIETVVPSLDVWVRLVPEIDDRVTIDPAQWCVLSRVGTGATARRIAGQLELGELDACRDLKGLIDRGLVEIDDEAPPVERASSGDDARRSLPAFKPPAFAAATIGTPEWTPPAPLGPDAVTEDPWGPDAPADEPEPETTDRTDEPVDVEGAAAIEAVAGIGNPVDLDDPGDAVALEAGVESELGPVPDPVVHEDAPAAEAYEADQDEADVAPDDFLTQLAHLSPKAAAAIEATASDGHHGADDDAAGDAPDSGDEPVEASADEASADQADEDLGQNLLLRFLSSTKQ